jgi:hypothetical protein
MVQPQTFPSSSPELEEVLLDRLEMDNLHVLNVVTAIGNDLKDDRAALLRAEKMTPLRCGTVEGGSEMPEDDTVNWKTQNHYYPPQQATPQPSTLSKLAGPLLIGASLLGAGGIGTAGWVAVKAIDKISSLQQPGKVEDGSMTIEFIGGQEVPTEN